MCRGPVGMEVPDFGSWWNVIRDAILFAVAGSGWPEGDEDALDQLGEVLTGLQRALSEMQAGIGPGADQVLGVWGGDVGAALREFWPKLTSDPGGLLDSIDAVYKAAFESSQAGYDIRSTKISIWAMLA